jgi:hypothetical protein
VLLSREAEELAPRDFRSQHDPLRALRSRRGDDARAPSDGASAARRLRDDFENERARADDRDELETPDSAIPSGEPEHPAQRFVSRLDEAMSVVELERLVEQLRGEFDHVQRRQLVALRVETRAELEARIVECGEGVEVLDVAIAMRTSEAIVRRAARLHAGRDAERRRCLALDGVPQASRSASPLIARGGLGVRVASAVSRVPRSTLHDAARRAP